MKTIFFILVLLSSQILFAKSRFDKKFSDSCEKYVNLQRENWIEQRNVPTLDQGPVELCYSHAATTLVDFYRDIHSLGLSKNIALSNPIYAALLYKISLTSSEKKSLGFGNGEATINAIRKYGMCRFDVIDSIMEKYSRSAKISTRDWYAITEWFLEFYDEKIEKEIDLASDKPAKLFEIFTRYEEREKIVDFYKHADFSKVYEAIKPYLKDKNYQKFAQDIFAPCFLPENIYLPTKRLPPVITVRKTGNIPQTMIDQLDAKNPVGIAYNGDLLFKKGSLVDKIKIKMSFPNHESVIIGKRVRDGQCQFLLKNTWGNYCKYSWECQKSPQGVEVGAWINADFLTSATSRIYYFKLKK